MSVTVTAWEITICMLISGIIGFGSPFISRVMSSRPKSLELLKDLVTEDPTSGPKAIVSALGAKATRVGTAATAARMERREGVRIMSGTLCMRAGEVIWARGPSLFVGDEVASSITPCAAPPPDASGLSRFLYAGR